MSVGSLAVAITCVGCNGGGASGPSTSNLPAAPPVPPKAGGEGKKVGVMTPTANPNSDSKLGVKGG
jgi:hypothetical protein